MGYPDPQRLLPFDRPPGHAIKKFGESCQIGDIAADRIEPDDHARSSVQRAIGDRLDLLLGDNLDGGDADGERWIGRQLTAGALQECTSVVAR